jgi:acyl-CoA thioesterase-1
MHRFRERWILLFSAVLVAVLCLRADAQTSVPLQNGDFENGLSGWTVQGEAALATAAPLHGRCSLRLGAGKSMARQRVAMGGLRILQVEATVRAVPSRTGGALRARCYDAHDHLLMDLRQPIEPPATGTKGRRLLLYFKTQAHTAYLVLSIDKETDAPGYLYADAVTLTTEDAEPRPAPLPGEVQEAMQPFWQGRTVYDETVLLLSQHGRPAAGRLLFTPTRILSVRDYAQARTYVQGRDYTLHGKTLTILPGSRMPTVRTGEVRAYPYQWYKLNGRHVVVTYTHADTLPLPIPAYRADLLPHTVAKLRHHLPVTVVTQGDSITLGNDGSGFLHIPPYLPPWPELFVDRLKHTSGDDAIRLYNTALGGTTSEWGVENADSAVAALDPDLVILAFGMNDLWNVPADQFRANIQSIIRRVRARRPEAEFILVASMLYDTDYAPEAEFRDRLTAYTRALQSLTGPGIRLLNMHALSRALYAAKNPLDFVSNPMHPNDCMNRWYAQSLAAMFDPLSDRTPAGRTKTGRP